MKIAVLADIHANAIALNAVFNEIDKLGISKLIICGDFVGYYYRAKEVMDLLKDRDIVACRGNHEDLFYKWCTISNQEQEELKNKYGSGFQIAQNELSIDQKEILFSLKHPVFETIDNKCFCIAHGSPWGINQYIYFDQIQKMENKFRESLKNVDVVVLGHTHYQGVRQIENLIIVNPGSVGQPRSGLVHHMKKNQIARAHWAVIDTSNLHISFMETLYDACRLFQEIDEYDFNHSYLRNVLYRTE